MADIKQAVGEALNAIEGLNDEQKAQIETIAQNLLNQEIGKVHGQWDRDLAEATGLEKPGGVKSYAFWKEQIGKLKDQATGTEWQTKLQAIEAEKAKLEQQLKEGKGDAALKGKLSELETALADEKARVKQLQGKYDSAKQEWEQKIGEKSQEYARLQVMHEFDRALAGKKPKPGIDDGLFREIVDTRLDRLLSKVQPEFDKDSQGRRVVRFRDQDGNLLNDPDNMHNPFTPERLVVKELADVLDMGKQQPGAGTGKSSNGQPDIITIRDAKSQVEASAIIEKGLMERGIGRSNPKFQEELDKAWKENNVAELPIK